MYQPGLASAQARHSSLVEGRYRLEGENRVRFEIGPYDRRRPVVIDPPLGYSTYMGGFAAYSIAVDASGNAYVTGYTGSNFPVTPGAFQTAFGGSFDGYVTELNTTGSALVYSTYLGGSGDDIGSSITVDASGNAYVTGETRSSDFPVTPGAIQPTYGGGYSDAFVTELNATGSALVYSTYLGGSDFEEGAGIAVDTSGSAYVTGTTGSTNFPTTPGAFQPSCAGCPANGNAFVTKLNALRVRLALLHILGRSGRRRWH